ncbi:MAG TPA: hypothetical protein VMH81_27605 [Bryobacteraceae bacterium]|nr:hypothetical protein [Bryobacteraceae bacterium]
MKLWHAVVSALLLFIPPLATAADEGNAAARELARKTAAFVGRGEAVSVSWANVSSLGTSELLQARGAFETALREAGSRTSDVAPLTEARVTLSENRTHYLLVEEIRRGEERQVWISAWKRSDGVITSSGGAALEKKLVWEQDDPMLDVAFPSGAMLVLSPNHVTLYARQNGGPWATSAAVALLSSRPWPRDLRGHLRVNGATFQAYLPGMACNGAVEPSLAMECKASDEPWVLESGSRSMLLGYFSQARNFFEGRVITQSGARKTVAPFYSAASADEQGQTLWLLALVDGRTQIFDAALDPAASIAQWGSDIAGTDAHCGRGSQVLATRPGDGSVTDAVQAFSIVNRSAVPLTPPLDFPGPVTALWPSGGSSVVAIVHNLATGKYEAYVVTVSCGG